MGLDHNTHSIRNSTVIFVDFFSWWSRELGGREVAYTASASEGYSMR